MTGPRSYINFSGGMVGTALIDFSTKKGLVLEWSEETEIMEWCFKESVLRAPEAFVSEKAFSNWESRLLTELI